MRDELSIYFENPATDPLGHECVEGKFFCDRNGITLRFKLKDRAFKKNEPETVRLSWSEVESVEYNPKFFGPDLLTLRTRETDKLHQIPGAEVAKVDLHVLKDSKSDAKKAADFVEYFQSEDWLAEQDGKISGRKDPLD